MTVGKAAALTAGFVGAVILGIAIGPSVTDRLPHKGAASQTQATAVAEKSPSSGATRTRATESRGKINATRTAQATSRISIPISEPRLHERLKPVLREGTKIDMAAEGFKNAEDFATVAHAARNTNVPFVVLKHRVVTEGRTLAQAIHEFKPEIDAKAEVIRARKAAKSDLAAIAG
jgi:hypothetical protein